jgi:hypothetical protein
MNDQKARKLFLKYKLFLKKKELPAGFECENGWYNILENLFKEILQAGAPAGFIFTKIANKYGELKIHTKNGNNTTRFAIEAAIEIAYDTCDNCGNNKELQKCIKCADPIIVVDPISEDGILKTIEDAKIELDKIS